MGQLPENRREHFRIKHMLGFREGGGRDGPGADLAHLFKPAAGMTQGAHRFERRIEQPEEQQAKVIFGQQFAAGILLCGRLGRRLQMGLETLAKLGQQLPASQGAFFQFQRYGCRAPRKAYRAILYKLQSCDSPVTISLRHINYITAVTLPNSTDYHPAST